MTADAVPFLRLSRWLRQRFGERVYKVSLRGGFTCPNRDGRLGHQGCAYCAGEALLPAGQRPGQPIPDQLAQGIAYIRKRHKVERVIAYFHDYTATDAPARRLEALFGPVLAHPAVVGLALTARPDCLAPDVLSLLEAVGQRHLLWLEMGIQVADDGVLRAMGRGHTVGDFVRGVRACHARGLLVCAHVIVGYPGVSAAQERQTIRLLSDLGVWGVKLHAFHVLAGSPLAASHRTRPLPLLSLAEYVARVADLIERLPPDVVVHRITAEAPRRETVAPAWTVNKMAVYDAVVAALRKRDTWQGRCAVPPARRT